MNRFAFMFRDPLSSITSISSAIETINIAGIKDTIHIMPVNSVLSLEEPNVDGFLPLDYIEFQQNSSVKKIKVVFDSGLFTETLSKSDNGHYWIPEILFDIAKDDAGLQIWLSKNISFGFLAWITTKNDNHYLIGDIEQPLFIEETINSSGQRAGLNKTSWKFTGQVSHPAYGLQNLNNIM